MSENHGDDPAPDRPEAATRPTGAWRKAALAAALVLLGFLGGLGASPWLIGDGASPGGGSVGMAARRTRPPDDAPLAVTPGERREAARLLLAASSLASAGGAAPVRAGDGGGEQAPLTLDRLPAPVRESLSRLAGGKPLNRLRIQEREREGQPLFDMRFELEAVGHELLVDAQGKLIEAKVDLAISELPHSISEQIMMTVSDAVLIEAEKHEFSDEPPYYEVELRSGGVRRELRLSESGEILRNRVK